MAVDLTAIWTQRAVLRDKQLREQLERENRRTHAERDQDDKDRDFMLSAMQQIEQSVARRIEELNERLERLDRASLQALQDADQRLKEIRENANHAVDGRRVYEAADGTIHDEQGNELTRDEIDLEEWHEDGPRWDEYRDALSAYSETMEFRRRVLKTQERLETDDLSEDDLSDIAHDLDGLERDAPEDVQYFLKRPKNGGGGPRDDNERATNRTTSAAKTLDDDPGASLSTRRPFYAAAAGVGPTSEDQNEPSPETGPGFTPD